MDTIIRKVTAEDKTEWLRMRQLLWDEVDLQSLDREMDQLLADPTSPVFVVQRPDGKLGGFLEAGTRKYADGCDSSPVGYIEGWYIDEDLRGKGVGGVLVHEAEDWAREQGCMEMGSDTWLDNDVSIKAHLALGYEEVERLIHFVKTL